MHPSTIHRFLPMIVDCLVLVQKHGPILATTSSLLVVFSMTGSNMTPTKTIPSEARCHYLTIYADYNCSSSSKLKVEIVNASTGAVLARSTSGAGTSGHVNVRAGNVSGKKVKIRFIVQDSNGNYAPSRSCNVSYSYNLCALSE